MTSYCRQWIPNYAESKAPLAATDHVKGPLQKKKFIGHQKQKAFIDLKLALQTTPTLGLPDPTRPFAQTVDEKNGYMTSVYHIIIIILEEHRGRQRPVAYFSAKLDSVAAGQPTCL